MKPIGYERPRDAQKNNEAHANMRRPRIVFECLQFSRSFIFYSSRFVRPVPLCKLEAVGLVTMLR